MSLPGARVAQEAARLATLLPQPLLLRLAELLQSREGDEWGAGAAPDLLQATPQPHFRAPLEHFLDVWRGTSPPLAPAVVALLLHTAASAARTMQATQRVELILDGAGGGGDHPAPHRRGAAGSG